MKLTKRTISNFATYFMGIAIGLVLVGAILSIKQKVFQQHQARQQAQPSLQQTPTQDEIPAADSQP